MKVQRKDWKDHLKNAKMYSFFGDAKPIGNDLYSFKYFHGGDRIIIHIRQSGVQDKIHLIDQSPRYHIIYQGLTIADVEYKDINKVKKSFPEFKFLREGNRLVSQCGKYSITCLTEYEEID